MFSSRKELVLLHVEFLLTFLTFLEFLEFPGEIPTTGLGADILGCYDFPRLPVL
jgi:hypothetical protein